MLSAPAVVRGLSRALESSGELTECRTPYSPTASASPGGRHRGGLRRFARGDNAAHDPLPAVPSVFNTFQGQLQFEL